jgi:hypothetical protein
MLVLLPLLSELIKKINIDYAVCGGGAIDLFLGAKTRPHKDLDVAVYCQDRDTIVQYMLDDGWSLYEPCGCEHLHKINNVTEQKRIKSNIWCLKPNNLHYEFVEHEKDMYAVNFDGSEQSELDFIEFLFNDHDGKHFFYSRNHNIKRELSKAILRKSDIYYLAPEVVLLYKSTALSNNDYQLDYTNTLPKMNEDQKDWLKDALHYMFPDGHEWLQKMDTYK